MKNRRDFIKTALIGGLATRLLPVSTCDKDASDFVSEYQISRYAKLDEVLRQPIFKKELFSTPVIIETVELLRYQDNFICRVRSVDGAVGYSIAHDWITGLYPIFNLWLKDYFVGKDARGLDEIMEKVYIYRLNYRLSGTAIGVPVATIEFAILDMMGHIANKSIGQLIGDIYNRNIPVYQATEYRERSIEESIQLIKRDVAENQTKALKIKVGGRMFWTTDLNAVGPVGRTEDIIPLIRKTFGDEMTLYADANGYYSIEEAIRVGNLLHEHRFSYFEEPVQFYWYEETKQVADALIMPIAGGEQEFTVHGFRWLIANDALQTVQPNNYYFGGMIRSMKVARMAEALGKSCTPHMSAGGLGYLYMMHFVSAIPNAADYHEFRGFGTNVIFDCETSPLRVEDGMIQVPTGPGLGVEIDLDFINKHEVVES